MSERTARERARYWHLFLRLDKRLRPWVERQARRNRQSVKDYLESLIRAQRHLDRTADSR